MTADDITTYMAEKGLGYASESGYDVNQVFTAAAVASAEGSSVVMARVFADDGKTLFFWGYYPAKDAETVALAVRNGKKWYANDVVIFDEARRIR